LTIDAKYYRWLSTRSVLAIFCELGWLEAVGWLSDAYCQSQTIPVEFRGPTLAFDRTKDTDDNEPTLEWLVLQS
jgi:hypothetical protein